ncbi:methyltransferase, partial [Micromonospora sp. LOL_024]|uniref:methyltransferase n=1 Tax=Micromonospora sp. LOL_024 TaxID=3345412 RepID=UPI003A8ADFAD
STPTGHNPTSRTTPELAKALAGDAVPESLAARVTAHRGDLFADPFPPGAEAVLFSHVLEIFPAERVIELLAKAFEALPYGGRVLLYGFNVTDDEQRGVFSARLSLYLNAVASGSGMAYPASDYESWLREVGFREVTTLTGLPYEHGLTEGIKP